MQGPVFKTGVRRFVSRVGSTPISFRHVFSATYRKSNISCYNLANRIIVANAGYHIIALIMNRGAHGVQLNMASGAECAVAV